MNKDKTNKETLQEPTTSYNEYEDDIYLEDILAFEKSLRENPNQINEWISGKEAIKQIRINSQQIK